MTVAQVSPEAAYTVWGVSLIVGVVVIVVVAVLLTLIVRTAREIEATVADIWTVGQRIANNTVHIPLLHRTNQVVDGILERAAGIDGAAAAIEQHAEDCPGCPQCVLGRGGGV
jgi:uncharacterized protein YoxC